MQHLTILSAQHDKIQVEIAHTEEMTSDSDIIINLKDADQSHDTHHPQIIVVGSTQETQARYQSFWTSSTCKTLAFAQRARTK
jgi:galactitol-specific phosphotransferase system IIB component